jgi:hypothetical protein
VIRGFEQVEGIDFNALHGWQIDHLDVVTAFLNPALDSDVYMQLPTESNWLDPDLAQRTPYVKLLKALYGLKQAPKLWHDEINGFLLSLGFRMKDLGPVRQFLGLEISRNGQHTITLGQQAYIDTIL